MTNSNSVYIIHPAGFFVNTPKLFQQFVNYGLDIGAFCLAFEFL